MCPQAQNHWHSWTREHGLRRTSNFGIYVRVVTIIGFTAGLLTTVSWFPQVVRSWRTRSTRDFSWQYLVVFTTGVVLWTVYGIVRADLAVFLANAVTLCLLLFLIGLKLIEGRSQRERSGLLGDA
jgi:MtN3 and saliva related transmembrane protein